MGTQLYDNEKNKIYPITYSDNILLSENILLTEEVKDKTNIDQVIIELYNKINKLSDKPGSLANNINFDIGYSINNYSTQDDIIDNINTVEWSNVRQVPTNEAPYSWKCITFRVEARSETFYELLESYKSNDTNANAIQNIYYLSPRGIIPTIEYTKKIINGQEVDDLTCFDNSLPKNWLEVPSSITPSVPHLYMSTRKKVNGSWERFSTPALVGIYNAPHQTIRYTITPSISQIPDVYNYGKDPGNHWEETIPQNASGQLWMITADSTHLQNIEEYKFYAYFVWSNPIPLTVINS